MPSTSICARARRKVARELGDRLADGSSVRISRPWLCCASERASSSLRMRRGAARAPACPRARCRDTRLRPTRGAAGWRTRPAWRGARPRRSSGCSTRVGTRRIARQHQHFGGAVLQQPFHRRRRLRRRRQSRPRPRTAPASPRRAASMARTPTRVFMRVDRLSSSGSRASALGLGLGRRAGEEARDRRRQHVQAPRAERDLRARSQRQLAPLGLRARDFDARLGGAAASPATAPRWAHRAGARAGARARR